MGCSAHTEQVAPCGCFLIFREEGERCGRIFSNGCSSRESHPQAVWPGHHSHPLLPPLLSHGGDESYFPGHVPRVRPGMFVPSTLDWALFFCTLLFKLAKCDTPGVAIRPRAGGMCLSLQLTSVPAERLTGQSEAGLGLSPSVVLVGAELSFSGQVR